MGGAYQENWGCEWREVEAILAALREAGLGVEEEGLEHGALTGSGEWGQGEWGEWGQCGMALT